MDRPLQIEVLINSPGPHDVVRVRQPFQALQEKGIDCRLHERPFKFNDCIRPHSLVIWQRPLPESWDRQIEHLQWLRERGCLLLTEWDDHPALFPSIIQKKLKSCQMAPLVACHAIHSSSAALVSELRKYNPLVLSIENGTQKVQALNIQKHYLKATRVFIGNQNRYIEHQTLKPHLHQWLMDDKNIKAVILGDGELTNQIDLPKQIEFHQWMPYSKYRRLLSTCQLALLPLNKGTPERCKTAVKWVEASSESVAVVAGPELYQNVRKNSQNQVTCLVAETVGDIVRHAKELTKDRKKRIEQVKAAHAWVKQDWDLEELIPRRLFLYQKLWRRRKQVDNRLMERLSPKAPLLKQGPFLS